MANARLQLAIEQIRFARGYTKQLLADVQEDEWFAIPKGGVSHFAWQMGHLAMAQYALTMLRIRGKEPADAEFISKDFMRAFMKGTTPQPDAAAYPAVTEIQRTFEVVYERALGELSECSEATLSESLPAPFAVEGTKLGSVLFCSHHEMLHAGQIGLIRRLLGRVPIR